MVCVMVGDKSSLGQIISKLETRAESTPLQGKLEKIAEDIGLLGTYTALLTIHVLMLRFFIEGLQERDVSIFGETEGKDNYLIYLELFVSYIIIGVAIIVVAVPEGLPLAVMISLAYSIERMLRDQNDVKRLASCEIMGGANNICSDKTGTLTLNQMKVTNVWAGKDITIPQTMDGDQMSKLNQNDYFQSANHPMHICQGISCNTPPQAGATDKAMIEFVERFGVNIPEVRNKFLPKDYTYFPFSSKRKRMSTIIENTDSNDGYNKRIHIKGAPDLLINACSHYMTADGQIQEINDAIKQTVGNVIENYAKQALRTIALGYKNLSPNENGPKHDLPENEDIKDVEKSGFTLVCVLGIMDIVRPEVPQAVLDVQRAGVTVRMVTGDYIVTAMAIAEQCHIIKKEEIGNEQVCMEGPAFYELIGGIFCKNCNQKSQECSCEPEKRKEVVYDNKKFKELMPRLKVLARSRPEDKYLLVTGLR